MIQDQRVSLGDRHWHTRDECFKCGVCDVSLMGAKMCVRHGVTLCSSACATQLGSGPRSSDLYNNGLGSSDLYGSRSTDLNSNGSRSSHTYSKSRGLINGLGSRSTDLNSNGPQSSDLKSDGPRSTNLISNGLRSIDLNRRPSPSVISYSTIV